MWPYAPHEVVVAASFGPLTRCEVWPRCRCMHARARPTPSRLQVAHAMVAKCPPPVHPAATPPHSRMHPPVPATRMRVYHALFRCNCWSWRVASEAASITEILLKPFEKRIIVSNMSSLKVAQFSQTAFLRRSLFRRHLCRERHTRVEHVDLLGADSVISAKAKLASCEFRVVAGLCMCLACARISSPGILPPPSCPESTSFGRLRAPDVNQSGSMSVDGCSTPLGTLRKSVQWNHVVGPTAIRICLGRLRQIGSGVRRLGGHALRHCSAYVDHRSGTDAVAIAPHFSIPHAGRARSAGR